jgi:hypothetical protein
MRVAGRPGELIDRATIPIRFFITDDEEQEAGAIEM